MLDTRAGASNSKDDPAMVAKAGFDALMAGDDKVVPGLKNKVRGAVANMLPDNTSAPCQWTVLAESRTALQEQCS
jgi:hypothetical protein